MERIVTKHIEITDYIKGLMVQKIDKLIKFTPNNHSLDTSVIVTRERENYVVEVKSDLGKIEFLGKGEAPESLAAFEIAMHKLEAQLHKYKEKLVEKH